MDMTDAQRLNTPRPAHGRRLAGRALDALHRQPRFQGEPAADDQRQGLLLPDADGRKIFDGLSGLWCCGLGHGRTEIAEAVGRQAARWTIRRRSSSATRCRSSWPTGSWNCMPAGLDCVFFTGSGSESGRHLAEDGARLLAHQGQASKTRFDRPREGLPRRQLRRHLGGWHGGQPQACSASAIEADHLPHTQLPKNAFSRGMPTQGAELADELLNADRAARRVQHRRRDRRAVLGLGRRGDSAGGLPAAPARDLHQQQHPADIRRGHHRLRPRRRLDRLAKLSASRRTS